RRESGNENARPHLQPRHPRGASAPPGARARAATARESHAPHGSPPARARHPFLPRLLGLGTLHRPAQFRRRRRDPRHTFRRSHARRQTLMHTYRKSNQGDGIYIYVVGFDGGENTEVNSWTPIEDFSDEIEAHALVNYLNGGTPAYLMEPRRQ